MTKVLTLGFLNAPVEGVRGLALSARSTVLQGVAVIDAAFVFRGAALKPGEEVPVTVAVGNLPLGVDIKHVRAAIEINEGDEAAAAPLTQSSTVKEGDDARTFEVSVQRAALPRNVSVRLDGGEPFWSFGDVAVRGSYELPDFARQANEYLDTLPPETASVAFKFLVKADGPGFVRIRIEQLDYSIIQTQSWSNPLDDTRRLDRTFELDFGSLERVPLDPPLSRDTRAVSLSQITLRLGGEFGPERLLTSFAAHNGREFASISTSYSLAQSFRLTSSALGSEKPINCVGVAGLFLADPEGAKDSEIYVEMQRDEAGAPAAKAPLSKSNLKVPLPEGSRGGSVFDAHEYRRLLFARFEAPVELELETTYWIVVKGVQGRVRLGLEPRGEEYLQSTLVNRGGQLWKAVAPASTPPVAALLRLIYLPEIDNQMAAVEIGIEGGGALVAQRADPGADAQTVTFEMRGVGGAGAFALFVKSYAQGTLSIANVIQEYTPSGTAAAVFQAAAR